MSTPVRFNPRSRPSHEMNDMPSNPKLSARLMVVEDERAMRIALRDCLTSEGYRVMTAENGEAALEAAMAQKPDLILLDVMMPRLDGFAVCRELRRLALKVPVLMLTAKGQIEDRVQGLDSGADDYLVKPFSTEELLARVRALLRRVKNHCEPVTVLRIGSAEVDFATRQARRDGEPVHLTAKEMAMLRLLAEARGGVVSREHFLDAVWGYNAFPTTRTVDNHIASLRAKLESDPGHPAWILTVHGTGYRLATSDFA